MVEGRSITCNTADEIWRIISSRAEKGQNIPFQTPDGSQVITHINALDGLEKDPYGPWGGLLLKTEGSLIEDVPDVKATFFLCIGEGPIVVYPGEVAMIALKESSGRQLVDKLNSLVPRIKP